jgi:hypothetical protein
MKSSSTHHNATPPPLNMLCTLMIFIALAVGISAWSPATTNRFTPFITALPSKPNPDNPCYDSDDDCLSTAYSASFIPAEWIRSMDCGKDVDCLPEKLSRPGTRGSVSTSTVYHVDRWLGVKSHIDYILPPFTGSRKGGCNGIFEHSKGRDNWGKIKLD